MNESYEMREERRKVVRAIMAAAKQNGKAVRTKAAKHSDRRETLAMIGPQVLSATKEYTRDLIASVPEAQFWILSINKIKSKKNEITMLEKSLDAAERKRQRARRAPVDVEEI